MLREQPMANSLEQRLLKVDLTTGIVDLQRLPVDDVRQFLGGRGIAAKLLYEQVGAQTDPLSPSNLLIFSPGVLTGTMAPAAARTTITSKSPLTHRYLKNNAGGHWGAELRYAGYDHIVVSGASDRPVYLWIDWNRVEIRDASVLWGRGTSATEDAIKAELDDPSIQTATVGPASENGVLYGAILLGRFNTAGRGGIGSVMASKKLKAIAVRGSGGIPVADAARFVSVSKEVCDEVVADETAQLAREYGIPGFMPEWGQAGEIGAYNFRRIVVDEADQLSGQHMANLGYFRAGLACSGCGIGCRHFLSNDSSPHGPLRASLPEAEPLIALGPQCGVTDTDAVLQASARCDELGLDVLSTGFSIAWAMECYEKGLISPKQADGLRLEFGDAEVLLELIERIAQREGLLGDLLAEGTQRAAAEVGGDSWKWAMQARGLEQSSPDARGAKGYALGFAVNARGPDHLTAQTMAEFGGTPEARAVVRDVCGDERYAVPYSSDKKAELVRWHEDCQAVSDALGVCMQVTVGPYMMTPERMAALLSATWGREIDAEELILAGRRIVTLERCFNVRQGAERGREQHLPWRMMHEPLREGPNAGRVTSQAEMDLMLDQYYSLHGWDVGSGHPTEEVLAALGLESLCSDLKGLGGGTKKPQ
jgi:aldehyde:ferredoxin oxidoreductase